jgi:hypothetical protein
MVEAGVDWASSLLASKERDTAVGRGAGAFFA